MKYRYVLLIMVVLLSVNVFSDSRAEYPNFFEVGEVEQVKFYDGFDENSSAKIILDGDYSWMTYVPEGSYFYSNISSNVEEDVVVNFVAVDSESSNYNSTYNMTPSDYYDVKLNDTFYVFTQDLINTSMCSQTLVMCANLNSVGQDSEVDYYMAYKKSNVSNYTWFKSDQTIIVPANQEGQYCEGISVECPGGDVNGYIGMKCNNCDPASSKYLQIGVNDVAISKNVSGYVELSNNNTFNDLDEDFTIEFYYKSGEDVHHPIHANFKFRIPFYIDIDLYKSNASDVSEVERHVNDFNYVYMKKNNGSVNNIPSTNQINSFFSSTLGWMPGIEILYPSVVSNDEVHWAKYQEGTSKIKLYEAGDYGIYILGLSIAGMDWSYEFVKPQYSDIVVDSKVVNINITEESNSSIKVFADRWEYDKFGVVKNLVRTVVIILLMIAGLGLVAALPGGSKLVGVIAPIAVGVALKYMGVL